jgi:hypothetical protein
MLWAKRQGKRQFRAYHDRVFERFWRRDDIEDGEAIASVLSEVHADRTGFRSYLAGAGRIEHDTIRHSAESAGVFGVPSFMVEGELFWRREHLSDIREKLAPLARCPSLCEMRNFSPGQKHILGRGFCLAVHDEFPRAPFKYSVLCLVS